MFFNTKFGFFNTKLDKTPNMVYTKQKRVKQQGCENMSVESFLELYNKHYFEEIVFSYRLTFQADKFFYGPDKGRTYNLLAFINNCQADFCSCNGEAFHANPGDIVYVPKGARYTSEIYGKLADDGCVLGINFFLRDDTFRHFNAGDDIIVFNVSNPEYYRELFSKMRKMSGTSVPSTSKMKSWFYESISSLCEAYRSKSKASKEFKLIEQGIKYLETDRKLDKSVADIAEMCAVSENYFRRLFKARYGVTPKQYILSLRISMAKELLSSGGSVSSVAEKCGFSGVYQFSRCFREITGISPSEYAGKRKA